jgi:NTE family protein
VINRGTVWKAVRASVSVPGMFPAALHAHRWLTDGGLVNPIPSDTVRQMGGDIVIGVDLLSPSGRARQGAKKRITSSAAAGRVPNLMDMIWRSMEIMQEEITIRSASFADVTIEPDLGRVRWKDFSLRGDEFIAEGARAAREKVAEIRQLAGLCR